MRIRHLFTAIAVIAVLTGCRNEEPASAAINGKGKPTPPAAVSKQAGVLKVLKNDAYVYSGLGQAQKLTYHGSLHPDTPDGFGTQTVTWTKNEDGSSYFEIKRDGILSGLGTERVRLDKNGAYITWTSAGSLADEAMTLPSTFTIGTVWLTELALDLPTYEITSKMTSKVVRKETITLAGQEFECFVVESDTTLTTTQTGTSAGTLKSTTYYAADYGVVRMEASGKNQMGDNVEIFVELAKIGE